MGYLNEIYPYRYHDAICCYYTYQDTCILQGVVNWRKELVIVREHHFEKTSKEFIASLINFGCPWINKNPYLAVKISSCYYQDFSDESDLEMLAEEFTELLDNKRLINEAEKTNTKQRPKCMQMMIKALSHALHTPPYAFMPRRINDYFSDTIEVAYRDYKEVI